MTPTKKCSKCGEEKPATVEFFYRAGEGLRLRPDCRVCTRANQAIYHKANPEKKRASDSAWQKANPERVRVNGAAWREANSEKARATAKACAKANPERKQANGAAWRKANPERVHATKAAWAKANPEKKRAGDAAYLATHREESRAKAKAWAKVNPEKRASTAAARRARKASAPVVESVDRAGIWARDGGRCHSCGKKCDRENWHLDHLVPLSLGGEHSARNLAVAHPFCNISRGNRGAAQPLLISVSA